MFIVIICVPVCDVIDFHINISLLVKSFSYMIKKPGQKFKYLKNEKYFLMENIFHHFKRAFSSQKLS